MARVPLLALVTATAAIALPGGAQEDTAAAPQIEEVVVIGSRQDADTVAGSGTLVDQEALEQFDYVDLNQVLSAVPGVYMREEDGFGLRPNIGIRGASAERSQKIAIMEDGVLITPAPYSAPAAYYVPNISRIHAVEVLKGPAAVRHGPHTVGGAVNFVTRPVPEARLAEIDLSAGNHGFHKVQAAFARPLETTAYLVEAMRYGSTGFKDLDGGGDTGFVRHALDMKWRWEPGGERDQQLTVKLGYADEDADETYLGLADRDFDRTPLRRYRASQLARFQSSHALAHVNYGIAVNDSLRLNAKGYWNRFDRQWNKVDGFMSGPALQSVLIRPGNYARQIQLLRGEIDSTAIDADIIDVTNNDRSFDVSGVQLTATATGILGGSAHRATAGVRLHRDQVDRDHRRRGYRMASGNMISDGIERGSKARNHADTDAYAVFVADEITRGDWRVTMGVRYEDIAGAFEDLRAGVRRDSAQSVVSPGLGVHWQTTPRLSFLAGVYRGFSPAGPGSRDVDPEQSVNLEYGVRFATPSLRFEAIGFFSDYENLLGRCRVSDSGCQAGEEFNGGRVEIAGAEIVGWARLLLTQAVALEFDVTYTYSESAFQTSFLSQFPQWGLVRRGDELPYLPEHIGRASAKLMTGRWEASAAVRGQAQMREEPGYENLEDGLHADGFLVLDLALSRRFGDAMLVQFLVGNATDEAAIVSHRPFGARPNRPRSLVARIKYAF
ncbi:MAG: TonB-dependent receptor [Gammaproteobacteria bacterium]|nr:TonB-dependent receptor [Gammaproteobacteria bacterium]